MVLDTDTRACFVKLLALGGYGRRAAERAAFVVAGSDGGTSCVVWPATNEVQHARWDGPVPPGTFAIAHTHPRHLSDPSAHDLRESSRTNLPIYVITPDRVTLAADSRGALVESGQWWRDR